MFTRSRIAAFYLITCSLNVFGQATSSPAIDLQDALARARRYGTQIQAANTAAALAREDRVQARANQLPSVNAFNQFIYTQGNGTPSGVFVANDGVHVYNEQAVVHEELLALVPRRRRLNLTRVPSFKENLHSRRLW